MQTTAHVYKSEDNSQVVRLGRKHLYWLSHLPALPLFFFLMARKHPIECSSNIFIFHSSVGRNSGLFYVSIMEYFYKPREQLSFQHPTFNSLYIFTLFHKDCTKFCSAILDQLIFALGGSCMFADCLIVSID